MPRPGCLRSYADMLIQLARYKFYTVGPLHTAMSAILYWYAPVPSNKAGRRKVVFTQGYRNKSSKQVQNRIKIQMVRKSESEIGPVCKRTIPFHMNTTGRSSSGPLSGLSGFLGVHPSGFHLLSLSILEKLSFPAELSVFFFIFRHKLLNFNLSEPLNSFFELYYPCFFFNFFNHNFLPFGDGQ